MALVRPIITALRAGLSPQSFTEIIAVIPARSFCQYRATRRAGEAPAPSRMAAEEPWK